MSPLAKLTDGGFADPARAKATVRQLRLRTGLRTAQASIAALLDLLDHAIDADGDIGSPFVECGVGLAESDLESGVSGEPIDSVERQDVREQELLEGVDLVLQFLNSLRVSLAHGGFSVGDVAQRKRVADLRHRLSGGAE